MKILIPKYFWIGQMIDNIELVLKKNGHNVLSIPYSIKEKEIFKNPLNQLKRFNNYAIDRKIQKYNERIKNIALEFKPDMIFLMNSGNLTPDTLEFLRKQIKCYLVCFLPDNPFDSIRSKYTPMNLPLFNTILSCEESWIQNIRNVAPKASVYKVIAGYAADDFHPVDPSTITLADQERFGCDVSFTGAGYGELAEGSYRALILNHISDFHLKFWSNEDWTFRFKYLPNLKKSQMGKRLSFENIKKLYTVALINLNMPSPQIISGFQPRILEIGACKGFQIADYRHDISKYFNSQELVTFNGIDDLREKIIYFKNNLSDRKSYVEKLYEKVVQNHTWDVRIPQYFELTGLNF